MFASTSLLEAIGYAAVAAFCLLGGAFIASVAVPSLKTRSLIQHLAAGFVFAAASVEVLPDVMSRHLPIEATIGFAAGVALMLVIAGVSEKLERKGGEGGESGGAAWSFIAVVVVDLLVDGLLIGVMVTTGGEESSQALLITIALAMELLALGLSIGASLTEGGSSRSRTMGITGGVALAPVLGAVVGLALGNALTDIWIEVVLAFAVAALLYLAAEELLKEAHEVAETPLSTALFFGGFFAVLLIDMLAAVA